MRGERWSLMQKRRARARHTAPTTTYATPRKGFLPPMKDIVLSTTDLPGEGQGQGLGSGAGIRLGLGLGLGSGLGLGLGLGLG